MRKRSKISHEITYRELKGLTSQQTIKQFVKENCKRDLQWNSGSEIVVAEDGEKLVGVGALLKGGGEAYIANLCRVNSKTYEGVGKGLINRLVDLAWRLDFLRVNIAVQKDSPLFDTLVKNYTELGFHRLHENNTSVIFQKSK